MIKKLYNRLNLGILQRYIISQFLSSLMMVILAAVSLFLVFDFFERMSTFVKEDATILNVVSYLVLKVPFIMHQMTPVAVLVATLLAIGKLAQSSEITAMRACGQSIIRIAAPLFVVAAIISGLMFVGGETVVPWAADRSEEIYTLDIKKKAIKGAYSRSNFWHRSDEKFLNVSLYDSSVSTLRGLSIFEFDNEFKLKRRTDAVSAVWKGPFLGWIMNNVVEVSFAPDGKMNLNRFKTLPLVMKEKPADFFEKKLRPETMNYLGLKEYMEKLQNEGVNVTKYLVDLQAKFSFPLVNIVLVIIAIPFALVPSRTGTLTISFVAGVTIGFGYYVVHAFCMSLGSAELIPVIPAAWAANIILTSIGGYLLLGTEV